MHKKRPLIPAGEVIPILSTMQGHPESSWLWEKHADAILRECGLVPTIHEPCLYSGIVDGKWVIFKCQIDDFAVDSLELYFTDMQTTYSATSHLCTLRCTSPLLGGTQINMLIWIHLFLLHLQHPWLLPLHMSTHHFGKISSTILGWLFFGMASPILYVSTYKIVGGGVTVVRR